MGTSHIYIDVLGVFTIFRMRYHPSRTLNVEDTREWLTEYADSDELFSTRSFFFSLRDGILKERVNRYKIGAKGRDKKQKALL